MGWLMYHRGRGESDRDHFQRELWPVGQYHVGECGTAGDTFYALCDPAAEGESLVLVVPQQRTRGEHNYGRKELEEASGPCDSQYLERVLDTIERAIPVPPNDWAHEGRARCWAHRLSFGDGDADAAFWEGLSGYCVEITSPDGAGADYEVVGGTTRNEELGLSTLRVRSWDADFDCPTGEPFELGLTGDEEVHVY